MTRSFPKAVLVAAFQSPHVPSPSLSVKTRKDTPGAGSWPARSRIGTHRRSAGPRNASPMARRPFCRRSRSSASQRTSSALKRRCSSQSPDQRTERRCSVRRGALDRPVACNCALPGNGPIWTPSQWRDPALARRGHAPTRSVRLKVGHLEPLPRCITRPAFTQARGLYPT